MPRRPLRIAIDLAGLAGPPDSEIALLIEQTARLCADLGHHVEAVFTLWPYIGGELVDLFSALRPEIPIDDLLEPWTIGLAEMRQRITPEQLALCFSAIAAGQQAIATFYDGWDVVLSPVTRSAPLAVGAMAPTRPFPDLS